MKTRPWLRTYTISLAAVAAAVVTRWAVAPWLGNYVLLAPLYGAVAIAVWIAGVRAALIAAVLGYAAILGFFILPEGSIHFFSKSNMIGLALYSASCALIVGVGAAMRRERRNAQIASQQVRIIADTMSVGVTRCSRDMRYVWVNQCYSDWIHVPVDQLVGRLIADVVGEEAFAQVMPYYTRVLNGETVHYEKEVQFKDVAPSWVSATYTPTRDDAGVIDGWVTVVIDITQRKRAEDEHIALTQELQRHSDEVRDSRRRIQTDYDALTRLQRVAILCGALDTPAEDCLTAILDTAIAFTSADRGNIQLLEDDGATLAIAVQRGFEEPFLRYFDSVQAGDAAACGAAMLAKRRIAIEDVQTDRLLLDHPSQQVLLDAGVRAVQSTPLLTSSGELLGVISTHFARPRRFETHDMRWMDLLAQQAADYLQRIESDLELRDADRKKDEFLAMLSHELRNPLAPIGYAAEILKKQEPSPAQLAKAREVIDRQVRQMARLLDDLMDVSRITRGTISLRKQPVELAMIVNEAVEGSRPLIEQLGHTLRVDIPSAPVTLDADATRLAQVLMNLLNNAAKYTERGGTIELSATREGNSVLVAVKDTGVGIPPEMLDRIFELFAQEDRSIERARGGLGIGLTLAQRLVAMHGGTLEARSDGAGRGSEFIVRLPVASENSVHAIGSTPERMNDAQPMRILVVDDNEDSAETLAMYLQSNGHRVRTADNGLAAVETAAEFRPDAVLMDLGLPKLNGYEAARQIRSERGHEVLLVAVTGWGQEADRRRSRVAGFDHHLTKPVELDKLRRLLAAARIPASRP